ncbi:uncharacterized protein LOC108810388 [Raphanus sativus]|uniref:Uncharacterized protein LOC108810388 n=1 Tax=Raphanus sativus TaxID=3726 RepID=A0A6J0JTC4_RAPSA|nr:uncharacterized protein LOC108810388 [Raphanus sativus]
MSLIKFISVVFFISLEIMKAKKMKKESNLAKLVKSPVRFLIMARDAYIRSMTSCSAGYIRGGGGGSGGFGLPAGNFQICEEPSTTLPRSFTLNSSTTTAATRERYRFVSDYSPVGGGEIRAVRGRPLDLRRNYSCMVMGRIDEEKACDKFEEEDLLFDKFKKRKIDRAFNVDVLF